MSKAAKAEQYDEVARERDLWMIVAHVLVNDTPDAIERIDCNTQLSDPSAHIDEGETYVYRLYGVHRAHGGILVRIFRYAATGQRDSVSAWYFSDWKRDQDARPFGIGMSTEEKIIAERLESKQREMWRAAK